jgi:hypothetical protein
MVKTRYQIIKNIQKDNKFSELVACGIISISIPTWLQFYETFLDEKKTNDKSVAIQSTSDIYGISNSQMYKIIAFMER